MEGDAVNFKAMLEDQRAFNQQIFPGGLACPVDSESDTDRFRVRLKDLALGMIEETGEFLRTFEWKSHRRRQGKLQNVAHSHEELIDMFKYWLSCAELAEFPMDRLEELYYAKSRVVQYRYQEEWMKRIDGPCVLVDIDNVLADYIQGVCLWAKEHAPALLKLSNTLTIRLADNLDRLRASHDYVNASSVGLSAGEWNAVKHGFRTQGGKRTLPVFPDAKIFLDWCRRQDWKIILVTSRPIDRYPNIFTDTLTWLHNNDLPFDYLWWADDKARRLDEYGDIPLRLHVVFAVDDDLTFINQYRTKGIRCYWLNRRTTETPTHISVVRSLMELMEKEKVHA
jgi:FMN phosphatase YigB (HAD superfamily)